MIKKWLKRLTLTVAALAGVGGITAAVWWKVAGRDFLYGMILPDAGVLLTREEIPPMSAAAFRRDLEFLRTGLPRLHVDYAAAFPAATVARRLDRLASSADSLSPERRALELFGVLALGGTGTGHTMVFPIQRPLDWRTYPVATYWFDDGLFVTAAAGRNEAAVGSRVVAVGGTPVAEVYDLLAPYVPADNAQSLRDNIPRLLTLAEPLMALGLAAADGALTLELEGSGSIRLEPMALTSLRGLRWSRRVFAPVDGVWSPADPRPRARNYAVEHRAESKTLFVALNQLENQGGESFADFAGRLDALAREVKVERFIVDLRSNSGGNNELGEALVRVISGHPVLDREGRFFVLIGRRTFSAAANLACALERRTRAIFVGETSGFSPNHYGDAVSFLLPGSKTVVRLASRRWSEDLPGVERAALEPHLPVAFLARHHFDSADPALAAIAAYRHLPRAPATMLPAGVAGARLLTPHHRVSLFERDGRARLAIDAAGPYVITDLYPLGAGRFATDLRELTLTTRPGGAPVLEWHGASWPLEPVASDHRLPLELLAGGEVARGVAALRGTARPGSLSSHFELAINRLAYRALADGRVEEALSMFTVNTELFPGSANVWDSQGDGWRAAGRVDDAGRAYRRALTRNPAFGPSRRSLAELGG